MKRASKPIVALAVLLTANTACAFAPFLWAGAVYLAEVVGMPVLYATSCGLAYAPPVRVFGTEEAVYGFDFGSLATHARRVYGLQFGFCGGAVEDRLCGLQLGVLAAGYASEELPFGEYHFCNLDCCHMNGLEFGTFAAKTSTANGLLISAVYAEAERMNGLQLALVNRTCKLRGLQVGLYNEAECGAGVQLGLLNHAGSGLASCLPIVNLVW